MSSMNARTVVRLAPTESVRLAIVSLKDRRPRRRDRSRGRGLPASATEAKSAENDITENHLHEPREELVERELREGSTEHATA